MNILKALFLTTLTMTLVGCASTIGTKCLHNVPGHNAFDFEHKITHRYSTEDATERKIVYAAVPLKIFSGITSANLKDSYLALTVSDYGYFEQYSEPFVNKIYIDHIEGRPFLASGMAIVMAGTLPIFAPGAVSEVAFGCDFYSTVLSSAPDTTRQIKTGKSEWKDIKNTHKILVSGFNKNDEFVVDNKEKTKVEIDLSSQILNSDLTKNTTIKVTCLDCDLLGSEEQSLYKDAKTSIELSYDFRPIKASLIEAKKIAVIEEERIKSEHIKREKEASNLSALQAQEALNAERQKQRVPLDEFKAQCEKAYKAGSKEFGDCVLLLNELNDAK